MILQTPGGLGGQWQTRQVCQSYSFTKNPPSDPPGAEKLVGFRPNLAFPMQVAVFQVLGPAAEPLGKRPPESVRPPNPFGSHRRNLYDLRIDPEWTAKTAMTIQPIRKELPKRRRPPNRLGSHRQNLYDLRTGWEGIAKTAMASRAFRGQVEDRECARYHFFILT